MLAEQESCMTDDASHGVEVKILRKMEAKMERLYEGEHEDTASIGD